MNILFIHIPFSDTSTNYLQRLCVVPKLSLYTIADKQLVRITAGNYLRSSVLGVPVTAGLLFLSRQRYQTTDGAATGVVGVDGGGGAVGGSI